MINKYHLTPETCIFYDDKKENVDTADKLGMNGVVFTQDTVNTIKKLPSIKDMKKDVSKNFIKESEEYNMYNTENELEIANFIIQCYEAVSMDNEDLDVVTEGTNLDARAILKKFKKEYKKEMREIKKNIKTENFDVAKKGCEKLLEILKEVKKEMTNLEGASTVSSVIFGFFTSFSVNFLRSFTLCLIPYFGSIIASIMKLINEWSKPLQKAINGEYLELDDFNAYKNAVESKIGSMERVIKNTMKKIDSLKKESEKAKLQKAKEEKEIKESAEFKAEKFALYEACNRGEITIEEREELFQNLRDKFYLESATPIEVVTEQSGLSNKEKFEKIRTILYERCNRGELTIEEREELVFKAKEKIFSESNNTDTTDMKVDTKKMESEMEKVQKDSSKDMEKAMNSIKE